MTETIQQLKEDIAVLQEKLQKLEELEEYKSKSPIEEAYKRWSGEYPSSIDEIKWCAFQMGYHYSLEDAAIEAYKKRLKEPEENEWKLAALRFGEKLSSIGPCGYYDFSAGEWVEWALNAYEKTADEYLKLLEKERARARNSKEYQPTPKTPEETEQSLREAFVKAQKTEKWKETQKLIDGPWMDEMVAELKGETLTDLIWNWWTNVFTSNEEWDAENAIEHLVDLIETFLPKYQSAAGSQNAYVESAVEGFNDAIKKIKGKLR